MYAPRPDTAAPVNQSPCRRICTAAHIGPHWAAYAPPYRLPVAASCTPRRDSLPHSSPRGASLESHPRGFNQYPPRVIHAPSTRRRKPSKTPPTGRASLTMCNAYAKQNEAPSASLTKLVLTSQIGKRKRALTLFLLSTR